MRLTPPILILAVLVLAYYLVARGGPAPLVVYCAHDSVYADAVLNDFTQRTGIPVARQYDTESTKSLGLVERLISEKDHPRCDVFWNNEVLGSMQLQQAGLLQPYQGSGFARIPAAFKQPDGLWVGFGARLRVYIVNTEALAADTDAITARLAGDLSRVAMAKPLYGTTLTHYTILWDMWGADKLKAWRQDCRARGLQEAMGNAQVKDLVASGVCDLGFTDTDDAFVALDEKKPVALLPVRLKNGEVICIPNTVSIIIGTPRLAAAQKLVDFLLSEECELKLANAASRQIPLGAVDASRLPAEVRDMQRYVAEGYPLSGLGPARAACLEWLKSVYVK